MIFRKKKGPDELSFLEHLEELRWHIIRSSVAIIVFGILAFVLKNFVFETIIFGPLNPDFYSYRALCFLADKLRLGSQLCIEAAPIQIVNLELAGQFVTHIKVSLILGLVVAFPYVFWEFWRFISPALYEKERKNTGGLVFFTSLLFLIGVLFGYYIITPFSVNFLGNYHVAPNVENTISLGSYITSISMLSLSSGIMFELPMVVYFLSKIGLLTPQFMKDYRKHAIVVILIISAIITPPDVTSQVLIAFPIYFLYELSIGISRRVNKKLDKNLLAD